MSETEEPDLISGEIIMEHKLTQDLIKRVEDCVDDVIGQDTLRDVTTVPGVSDEGPITYDMLQDLLQRVYDQPYEAPIYFGPTYAQDEIPPEKYDRNNPFHYIQRYGRQGALRPMPTVAGRTLSDAEALETLTRARRGVDVILGRGNAEALSKSNAGDIVSDVISRDRNGRFVVMGDEDIQHERTPDTTSEPAREGASAAESEAGAVNRNPQ